MIAFDSTKREVLGAIGLTSNEIECYLYLLSNPNITASEIARTRNLDKSSTYRAVENLEREGLILSSPKKRGTTYKISSPEALNELYESRVRKIEGQRNIIQDMVNDIRNAGYTRNTSIKVEYGIDAHLNSMLESKNNNRSRLILEKWDMQNPIFQDKAYNDFVYDFAKDRVKRGIRDEYIVNSKFNNEFSTLMHTSEALLKEVRISDPDADDTNSFRIYDDTTEVISFDDSSDFIIITIKDPFVTEMIRKMFYFIWSRSRVLE